MRWAHAIAGAIVVGGAAAAGLWADEPARAFVDGLRERRYYDTALEYLEAARSDPAVSDEFKRRILFEAAAVHLELTEQTRDIDQIQEALDRADELLKQFAAERPDPVLLAESERVRAQAIFARGKVAQLRAAGDRATADEQRAWTDESRARFSESLEVFRQSLKTQADTIQNFKIDPGDNSSRDRLEALRREYVRTRFMAPAISEQIADSYPALEPKRKKLLGEAAAEYQAITEKYHRYPEGVYARVAAARCFQKMDEPRQALPLLIDVLADNLPIGLKAEAAEIAIACWRQQSPPAHADICGRIAPLVQSLSTSQLRDARYGEILFGYASACLARAKELEASPQRAELSGEINALRRDASRFAGLVSRMTHPRREEARALIGVAGVSADPSEAAAEPPKDLEEARTRGLERLAQAEDAYRELQALGDAGEADSAARREELQAQMAEVAGDALRLLATAADLLPADANDEDRNAIRVRQCRAYQLVGRHLEAVVLGSFLLEKAANIAGTRDAVALAIRSALVLHEQAGDDRAFERRQLIDLCERFLAQWPGEAGAEDAGNVLVTLALQDSDTERALSWLDRLPPQSATRARFEAHLGRCLWNDYLKRSRVGEADGGDAALLDRAQQLLTQGTAGWTAETLTLDAAFAALNLAQLLLERGDVEQAIERLEAAPIGPLDVIKQKLAPAENAAFVRETYRTALRAYVAGMRDHQRAVERVSQAQNIVAALRQTLADDPNQDSAIAIYFQLARELIEQLDRLTRPEEKEAFAQSLAAFLQSIQQQSSDFKTLLWIGSTLNSVAESLSRDGLNAAEKAFRDQAVSALDAAAAAAPQPADPADTLAMELKRQKAIALRGQGNFDAATDLFAAILRVRPQQLDVQLDAARTLQQQGDAQNAAAPYAEAVSGARRDPEAARPTNVIWGWRQLAVATRGKDSFRDAFYESLYNMAYCQLRFGEIQKRDDAKSAALQLIRGQFEQFPDMGGPRWKTQFDQLARRIQTSLGQPADGLWLP